MKEGLEKMLGLALLRAQTLEWVDDGGEFLLKRERRDWSF